MARLGHPKSGPCLHCRSHVESNSKDVLNSKVCRSTDAHKDQSNHLVYPIGSMVLLCAGIYANIGGILMGSMLPYIAAPWILWVQSNHQTSSLNRVKKRFCRIFANQSRDKRSWTLDQKMSKIAYFRLVSQCRFPRLDLPPKVQGQPLNRRVFQCQESICATCEAALRRNSCRCPVSKICHRWPKKINQLKSCSHMFLVPMCSLVFDGNNCHKLDGPPPLSQVFHWRPSSI